MTADNETEKGGASSGTSSTDAESTEAKFRVGILCVRRFGRTVPYVERMKAIGRHSRGDWGDVSPEERRANERALQAKQGQVRSVFHDSEMAEFWVVTEWNQVVTTVMMPDDEDDLLSGVDAASEKRSPGW